MITATGKTHIKRFLAGLEPDLARAIAFGVGEAAESVNDTSLQFEIGRTSIDLVTYDFTTDRLIFKANLEEGFDGILYEYALYSREDSSAGAFGSRLITSFDSDTETWTVGGVPATYRTTSTRVGNDSVVIGAAANGNATAVQQDITMDFSEYSAADQFSFAFYNDNTNLSSLRYRFYTDLSNYYDISFNNGNFGTAFNIVKVNKGNATVTGTPSWGNITRLDVTAFSTGAGTSSVGLEAIRIEDVDTVDSGYVMIARAVLGTPFAKIAGRTQEIEFPLGVTI
jgi:hypothetical protein